MSGHAGKKEGPSVPGKCSLDASNFFTDIIEAAMNLAEDAIDESEYGGNAPACTDELRKAISIPRWPKTRPMRKPGRLHKAEFCSRSPYKIFNLVLIFGFWFFCRLYLDSPSN